MGLREDQLAHNEEIFRRANERLREDWQELGVEGEALFLCECGDAACREPIRMSMSEYAGVRAAPDAFLLVPGHERPELEGIVYEGEGFSIVEKLAGEASVATETDPRS